MNDASPVQIAGWLQGWQEQAQKSNSEWVATFTTNPTYALEWSDKLYDNAAILEVTTYFIDLIAYGQEKGFDDAAIKEEVAKTLQRDFTWRAEQSANRSTSGATNMLHAARVTTLAKFFQWLNGR